MVTYDCESRLRQFNKNEFLSIGYTYASIAVVGSVLNIFALYCFWKTRHTRRTAPTNQILLSLNLHDTINCVVFIPISAGVHLSQTTNCIAHTVYVSTGIYSLWYSSFLVLLIAVHRYNKVTTLSLDSQAVQMKRLTRINMAGLGIIVLASLALGILPVPSKTTGAANTVAIILTMIILPIVYFKLVRVLRASQQRVQSNRSNQINNKITINVLILMTCYFMCNILLFVIAILIITKQVQANIFFLAKIGVIMLSCTSCINPFIYLFREASYKKLIKSMFCNNDSR